MSRTGWNGLVMTAILAIVVLGGGSYGLIRRNQKATAERLARETEKKVFDEINDLIDDFHGEMIALRATGDTAFLTQRNSEVKAEAQKALKKLEPARFEADRIYGENATGFHDIAEATNKYLEGYVKVAEGTVDVEVLKQKGIDLTKHLDDLGTTAGLKGSPETGDVLEAVGRVGKIKVNLQEAQKKPVFNPAARPQVVVVNGGGSGGGNWSNPEYRGYQEDIRDIVDAYGRTRTACSTPIEHFKEGRYSNSDRAALRTQINARQALLERLADLDGDVPPGGIYREQHNALSAMISKACDALEHFEANETEDARRYVSQVSDQNTEVMNGLKRFYDIND